MSAKIRYEFSGKVWRHPAPGGWFFVSLPGELAAEIRGHSQWREEGWGRIRATAKIGATQWETAVWYDTAHQTYLLPIKAEVRKKECIEQDACVQVLVYV
jgi:hypothetical protein